MDDCDNPDLEAPEPCQLRNGYRTLRARRDCESINRQSDGCLRRGLVLIRSTRPILRVGGGMLL